MLVDWTEQYEVCVEVQAGFRLNMGTFGHIFVLHELISHFINISRQLYCVFIDFTKSFDYVVRDNLWFKLLKLGIRRVFLTLSNICIQL